MQRYFFNIHNGGFVRDEVGVELEGVEAIRGMAMRSLPKIAADEIPSDGDRRHFAVVVTDEVGHPVYSAALSYIGLWLVEPTDGASELGMPPRLRD